MVITHDTLMIRLHTFTTEKALYMREGQNFQKKAIRIFRISPNHILLKRKKVEKKTREFFIEYEYPLLIAISTAITE